MPPSPGPGEPAEYAVLDDRALLTRHVAGDSDAFGELFRRHRDRMWAVALSTLGDRESAADCVQDAFLSAFRRASSFRGEAAVTSWLHRIVINACIDRMRSERSGPGRVRVLRSGDAGELERADPHDRHAEAETAHVVRAALARMPEAQRLALVLVDMHGFSVAEASAILDVPEGTVKSRCFRGRVALAAQLASVDTSPVAFGEAGTDLCVGGAVREPRHALERQTRGGTGAEPTRSPTTQTLHFPRPGARREH